MLSSFSFCSRKTRKHAISVRSPAKREKEGKNSARTDPFADLSVDEDQVIQGQNYFCRSASPSSEAEACPSVSPGQSDKRKQVSRLSCVCLSHTGMLLRWTYLKAKKKLAPTPASAIRRSKRKSSVTESRPFWKRRPKLVELNTAPRRSHSQIVSPLTSAARKIRTEPAAGVCVRSAASKVDGATQVLQTPGDAVRMTSLQRMGGVQGRAHAAVIQHYVACLHALAVPASSQGLVEAFEFKATLALTEDVSRHPVAPAGPGLLSSHSYVVHHVVDSAKKRRNLKEETATW